MIKWLALAAVAAAAPASAAIFDGLQLVYHATFANGSLESSIDPLGIGPLKFGNSGEPGINPSWTASQGDYLITVTRPNSLTSAAAVLAGIDATPVNFDVGSVVGLRATLVAPMGPHDSTDIWAIALAVETGGADPLIVNPSAAVTLQVRGSAARFNTPGADPFVNLPNMPQEDYDAIFNPTDPQPFTLELLVDRKTGHGEASLKVGDAVFSRTFQFFVFKPDSGPVITDIGVHIGIPNSSGQPVSVRLRDFQIFTTKRQSGNIDPSCPSDICRLAPVTKPH